MAKVSAVTRIGWVDQLRRRPELRDISKWPMPAGIDGLKPTKLRQFYRRRTAIMHVVEGKPVSDEARYLGVSCNEVYRLLDRALGTIGEDEPALCLGLIPDKLINARIGRFMQLELRCPEAFAGLRAAIAANLRQCPDTVRFGTTGLWSLLMSLLSKHGVKGTEYPFTAKAQARESLRKWVIQTQIELSLPSLASQGQAIVLDDLFDVFDVFQLDGHLHDFQTGVVINTGQHQCPVKLPRIWLLCACDEKSEYIVGRSWGVCAQYNQDHVLECLSDCTRNRAQDSADWSRLNLPPVRLPNSATLAAITHAVPAMIKLDNAWANQATHVRRFARSKWKTAVNYGIPKQPIARRVIEMAFQRLAGFEHLIPSTTGSDPFDPLRDRTGTIPKLQIEDIPALIDWAIARINDTPNAALKGMTPLQYIEHRVSEGMLVRRLDTSLEPIPNPFIARIQRPIKGSPEGPDIFHVNFQHGRYVGRVLGQLMAKGVNKVDIEYDRLDGRVVTVIDAGGKPIATLELQGPWRHFKHEVRFRANVCTEYKMERLAAGGDISLYLQQLFDRSNSPRGALQLFALWQSMRDRRFGSRTPLRSDPLPPAPNAPIEDRTGGGSIPALAAPPAVQIDVTQPPEAPRRATPTAYKPLIARRAS